MQTWEPALKGLFEAIVEHGYELGWVGLTVVGTTAVKRFFGPETDLTLTRIPSPPVPPPTDGMIESDLLLPLFRSPYLRVRGLAAAPYYNLVNEILERTNQVTTVYLFISMVGHGLKTPPPGVVENLTRLVQEGRARFHYIILARGKQRPVALAKFARCYPFAESVKFIDRLSALPPEWHNTSFMLTDSPRLALTHQRDAEGLPKVYCLYNDSKVINHLQERFDSLMQQSSYSKGKPGPPKKLPVKVGIPNVAAYGKRPKAKRLAV